MTRAPERQEGQVETSDRIRLVYDHLVSGADTLIVVSHGIFGHRRLPELEQLARRLAGPFDVLTFDCRGHGESSGRFSFGMHEWRDLADLVDQMRGDYRAVAGIGFSFGGFHTCVAAARTGCFDAAVLVSTPKDLFIADHLPSGRGLLGSLPLMTKRKRRRARFGFELGRRVTPLQCIGDIAVPLHIVHGDRDWLVHHRHALELHRRARVPTALSILDGGVHAEYLITQMPQRFLPLLQNWLSDTLQNGAGSERS